MPQQLLHRPNIDPASTRCVANECRNTCGVAGLAIPARRAASFMARCTAEGCKWCRRPPPAGTPYRRRAGNTHCHPHSRATPGYLRTSAPGIATLPPPARRSRSCNSVTRSRCRLNGSRNKAGSTVTRSPPPFARVVEGRGGRPRRYLKADPAACAAALRRGGSAETGGARRRALGRERRTVAFERGSEASHHT
jgi:hypothetical protein